MLLFNPHRRNPDQIADGQLIVGFAAFFIDPYFSLTDYPIYPRLRYIFKRFKQEVIQPLITLSGADFNKAYVGFLRSIRIQMMAAQAKCVIFWRVALYCLNHGQYTTKTVFYRKQTY